MPILVDVLKQLQGKYRWDLGYYALKFLAERNSGRVKRPRKVMEKLHIDKSKFRGMTRHDKEILRNFIKYWKPPKKREDGTVPEVKVTLLNFLVAAYNSLKEGFGKNEAPSDRYIIDLLRQFDIDKVDRRPPEKKKPKVSKQELRENFFRYLTFEKEMRAKYPNLSLIDLKRKAGEEWRKLTKQEKERYSLYVPTGKYKKSRRKVKTLSFEESVRRLRM